MAKKKKEIKQWDEAVDDLENYETQDGFVDINDENNPNSVYLFHNTKSGINFVQLITKKYILTKMGIQYIICQSQIHSMYMWIQKNNQVCKTF